MPLNVDIFCCIGSSPFVIDAGYGGGLLAWIQQRMPLLYAHKSDLGYVHRKMFNRIGYRPISGG